PGHVDGLLAGRDGEVDEAVHLADALLLDPFLGIEALHLAGDLRRVLARIELRDPRDAALAGRDRRPRGLRVHAARRARPDARDDDSAVHAELPREAAPYFFVRPEMYVIASPTVRIFSVSSSGM